MSEVSERGREKVKEKKRKKNANFFLDAKCSTTKIK